MFFNIMRGYLVPAFALRGLRRSCNRPPGGNRPLAKNDDVFLFNNWDNVVWDEEQEKEAQAKVASNSKTPMTEERVEQYEKEADMYWDKFYGIHQNRFFKDRHWLFTEFPELSSFDISKTVPERVGIPDEQAKPAEEYLAEGSEGTVADEDLDKKCHSEEAATTSEEAALTSEEATTTSEEDAVTTSEESATTSKEAATTFPGSSSSVRLFEVGCGVGNTVFPVLRTNNDPKLFVYCCDLSKNAIDIVKEDPLYAGGRCHGFVADVTDLETPLPFPENSLDLVILIFVLSAISPEKMQRTIDRLARHLKPGGKILFRDYGRYDLAQLRFKDGKCISDNFYARGDGTRVYFFTQDELRDIFTKAGLTENQNYIDRRLQVNRGRQLKMYRVWIQCKYEKPTV